MTANEHVSLTDAFFLPTLQGSAMLHLPIPIMLASEGHFAKDRRLEKNKLVWTDSAVRSWRTQL